MTRALYSLIVAVIVMLAVPVSQLQLEASRVECCCPDQSKCKCPDHDTDGPAQPTVKACHKTSTILASAAAPVLAIPELVAATAPVERASRVAFFTPQPHEPPTRERPRGPS